MMRNGKLWKGEFVKHQPHGSVQIEYYDGSHFSGEVKRGVIDGIGELRTTDGFGYAGQFVNDVKEGPGRLYIQDGSYSLEGEFRNGESILNANEVLFELLSPEVTVEEVADPKGKKDPKAGAPKAFTEEEEEQYGHKKIYIESKTEAEPKEVSLKMQIVFQGEPYPDPDQDLEAEAEAKKGKKDAKGKAAVDAEPEIRMITPAPVTLQNENGRLF